MPSRLAALAAVLAGLLAAATASAVPTPIVRRLADLRTSPDTSTAAYQGNAYRCGSQIFFFADDAVYAGSTGTEPWVTDGTEAGTRMLADVWPGTASGFAPTAPAQLGDACLFAADDGSTGRELWRADASGVALVKDLFPGPAPSSPGSFVTLGGRVLFSAVDPAAGRELFSTDGTAAGTALLADIRPGPESSSPTALTPCNGKVFFTATDATHGAELWVTDGTAAGTALAKDVASGPAGSGPAILACFAARIFFSANDGSGVRLLWRSDGTEAGTAVVGGSPPSPAGAVVSGGALYFTGRPASYDELFRTTDGLTATQLTSSGASIVRLFDAGGRLFVFRSMSDSLFRWDEPSSTVVLVKGSSFAVDSASISFTGALAGVNGTLYLKARSGSASPWGVWKSDGTDAGTVEVTHQVSPVVMLPDGTDVLILGSAADMSFQLWRSDGTTAGTSLLSTISTAAAASNPTDFVPFGGSTYFTALDDGGARELYSTDGTTATRVRGDAVAWWAPQALTPWNGALYFAATSAATGLELYRSDGTLAGTQLLKDIYPGTPSGLASPELVASGSRLFFAATSPTAGKELWASDGTPTGTAMVKDIVPGTGSSNPGALTDYGGVLLFSAQDGATGYELWRSDGTAVGTARVADILLATGGSEPKGLTPFAGLIFLAATGPQGRELYRTDGTEAGTSLVADVCPGTCSSSPELLTVVGDTLFFAASDVAGLGLWKTDGTEAGTSLVRGFAGISSMASLGRRLYLAATDGVSGYELWRSDGTAGGTTLVVETFPGSTGGLVGGPLLADPVHGVLFFAAADEAGGMELWASNGTAPGTFPVADIRPGPLPSSPGSIALAGDLLFFSADDGVTRREPWVLELTSLGDIQPPQVTCPAAPAPVEAGSAAGAAVSFDPATATDDVTASAELVISYSAASGSIFPVGTTTVVVTATDAAGNLGTCSFEVVVTGTPPPPPPPPPSKPAEQPASGCGCGTGSAGQLGALLLLLAAFPRRRRRGASSPARG